MEPPTEETRSDAGSGGSDDVALEKLVARIERCEEQIEQGQQVQAAIIETLDRDLRFAAKELRALLA